MLLFPEQLRKLREAAGLRQADLARAVGVDIPMYSRFEHGARRPKRKQVEKMAKMLNADCDDLIARWLAYGVIDEIANDTLAGAAIPFIKNALHVNKEDDSPATPVVEKVVEKIVEKVVEVPVYGSIKRLTPTLPSTLLNAPRHLVADIGSSHLPRIVFSNQPEVTLSEIEDRSVDCVVTTLPRYIELGQALMVTQILSRCLADDGSLWIHVDSDDDALRAMRLAIAMIDEQGWTLAHHITWDRGEGAISDGLSVNTHPILHFVKQNDYFFNPIAMRQELENAGGNKMKSGAGYRRKIENSAVLTLQQKAEARVALDDALDKLSRGEISDFRLYLRESHIPVSNDSQRGRAINNHGFYLQATPGKPPSSIWEIPIERDKSHDNIEVTSQLLVRAVLSGSCRDDGLVVDPWCGNGNTARVAQETGRRSICVGDNNDLLDEVKRDTEAKVERPKQATLSLF